MPSFDIESTVNTHELMNAVDQAKRELKNRFDFKSIEATFAFTDNTVIINAPEAFQTTQMKDILDAKLIKRGIDISALHAQPLDKNLAQAKLILEVKQGLDHVTAKKIVKFIKDANFKVQATIQGEKIRVSSKKRDDLQGVIVALKEKNFSLPLQFENFRD